MHGELGAGTEAQLVKLRCLADIRDLTAPAARWGAGGPPARPDRLHAIDPDAFDW
jgi:hypothetical protein